MNFDKLNQWLTLVANAGMIAGIVFVAFEVNQNSTISEATARQEVASLDFVFLDSVLDSSVLAIAYTKFESGEPLSPLEESQMVHRQHLNFRVFEHSFYQYQKGLLDLDQWQRHERIAQSNLSGNIYAQRMWQKSKTGFSPDFAAIIDR